MKFIDYFLIEVVDAQATSEATLMPSRDFKVLQSLATAAGSNYFVTENQSRLALKILNENQEKIQVVKPEITEILENPLWSKKFRKLDQVRKFTIEQDEAGENVLSVEFTYSSAIRKTLAEISKKIENVSWASSGKKWTADLTEKNIVTLYELLKPLKFTVDATIQEYYKTIKSWKKEDFTNQFSIAENPHKNFQSHVASDLGNFSLCEDRLIKDRSIRYQYFHNFPKIPENSEILPVDVIASRTSSRIWLDNKQFSLTEIISALVELNRMPVLFVFDGYDEEKNQKNLEILHSSLKDLGITKNVGIYFRLSNTETGKKFNSIIKDNAYNVTLDNDTKIVGVQSGKIPKFFISNKWKPMSVVVLDTSMRQSKTSVFTNDCDLIISHSEHKPLM